MSTLVAFTADHVCRLTGLSKRQLGYWDRTDFFSPQFAGESRKRPFSRIYSFRDLVGLRAIALLRIKHGVPLQTLRRVGAWLLQHDDSPWSSLKFYVANRQVFFNDPLTGTRMAAIPEGQQVFPIEMEPIARDMEQAANQLRERISEEFGQITRNRYVVRNAWVLAGTRIPTSAIWDFHQAGFDAAAIIREYPRLTPQDIDAAITHEEMLRQQVG
ncbi:MAG: DUF433 domain-containing protein [Thermomicrobiales bacterium]